jgi:hypothetical protein
MNTQFEKWAANRPYGAMDLSKDKDGYISDETDAAWEGWQAALSTMGDVVAVSELRPLIAGIAFINNPTGQRILEDLSAILNRGGK